MKNTLTIRLLSIVLIALGTSCGDILDVKPESVWESDSFYSNPQEAEIALAGIYGVIASDFGYGRDLTISLEAGTDEMYYNRSANENWGYAVYRNTPSDDETSNLWTNMYEAINLSNLFLESISPSSFETEEAFNALVAEARFLRALCYFNLANYWEEVPLRLTSSKGQDDNHAPAASLTDIYAAIVDDLTYATEHLPHPADNSFVSGRAHRFAAHGLLARVYLKMSGYPLNENHYQKVMDHCEVIISDGYHQLTSNADTTGYRQVFYDLIGGNYNTTEVLFEIAFQNLRDQGLLDVDGRHGNLNGINFGSSNTLGDPNGYAMAGVYPSLANLFDKANDKRYQWNIASYKRTGAGDIIRVASELSIRDFCPAKFRRWEPLNYADLDVEGENESYVALESSPSQLYRNFTTINFPVLRYSDVLLMYAEAANEVSGGPTSLALEYLNEVRNRAGLENIEAASPVVAADQQLFFEELVDERARELCFEGIRRFDLVRWELLGDKLAEAKTVVEGHPDFSSSNQDHLSIIRPANNFDPSKHLSLPYPLVEVTINQSLNQKESYQ
ncbi:RagB/SusD family nutrient uptake outer membrane protein [Marinoscillum furvescens]|uniref:Putative outer membrane starch-binding protein n=1 Tax=Marinoscillum furvescens DSM 4134 TaxID=1122208 RepID=A0A3D9L725_MARFU|nr:RagB/SusD family nutrient uptake outer membrane protein [Marinoscillum furvescens]REE01148.1 putative outer membrane starch-binding protein [Marinoscillum furvescens DSM 4134]